MIEKCISCKSSRIESGILQTSGRLHFHPSHTKFLTVKTSDIKVSAFMCLDCGYIHMAGDVEKANVLVDENRDLQ
jgi:predicted nucleic-acid-binding Zn-ribbon protein